MIKNLKLFFCLFFLFSCGYEPIHSKKIKTNPELYSISVKNIKDRSGQILKNSLVNSLNPDGIRVITKYRLFVEISESKSSLAYRKDMSATRTDLQSTAKYLLRGAENANIVLKDEVTSITSFDVVESVYANFVAEKDAREKTLKIISDDIYDMIYYYVFMIYKYFIII